MPEFISFQSIFFLQDGVAVVTFDTPNSKVNSLNKEVMAEMGEVEPENIL